MSRVTWRELNQLSAGQIEGFANAFVILALVLAGVDAVLVFSIRSGLHYGWTLATAVDCVFGVLGPLAIGLPARFRVKRLLTDSGASRDVVARVDQIGMSLLMITYVTLSGLLVGVTVH